MPKEKDKTDEPIYTEYRVSEDEKIASDDSDMEDACEEYEDRTWMANVRIYHNRKFYKKKPRDRHSVDIEHLVSEFNKAWKNRKGRKRIEKEYKKAVKKAKDARKKYADAFADPRDLPRVN